MIVCSMRKCKFIRKTYICVVCARILVKLCKERERTCIKKIEWGKENPSEKVEKIKRSRIVGSD